MQIVLPADTVEEKQRNQSVLSLLCLLIDVNFRLIRGGLFSQYNRYSGIGNSRGTLKYFPSP
jgi:hypothetical protein